MVWDVIAYSTRSPLVLICGTMTAQRYIHDILQPHALPLMQRLPEAIFQQDNARLHTARVSQDYLRTVTTLPWNAQSPGLSPIEPIWDHLRRKPFESKVLSIVIQESDSLTPPITWQTKFKSWSPLNKALQLKHRVIDSEEEETVGSRLSKQAVNCHCHPDLNIFPLRQADCVPAVPFGEPWQC
ncbi:transposable element Tcb2 transposase [Trichonephila clavipes]|nr:transposable element Tcb2 transposase [Trichonephila clavipes]